MNNEFGHLDPALQTRVYWQQFSVKKRPGRTPNDLKGDLLSDFGTLFA